MATIGRTFSDPDKWEENWFLRLPKQLKYLYVYLWERCDHAGVIEVHLPIWSAHTGFNYDQESLNKLIEIANGDKERILDLKSKIWFTAYIRFNQQTDPTKGLSSTYTFHKHVYGRLKNHNLVDEVDKRDPILLKEFKSISQEETIPSKANGRLSEDLPKKTGKGAGRGKGEEQGQGASVNLVKATNLFGKLKSEIPIPLNEYPEHVYLGDIERLVDQLKEEGIKNIEAYLITAAKNFDWENSEWDEFTESLIKNEDVPF